MKVQIAPYIRAWPVPVALVGCGTVAKPNLISIATLGTVAIDPPVVSISIRPSRFSFRQILQTREFTINLAGTADIPLLQYCGDVSGRSVDKFRELKLTPISCPPLKSAPMIAEAKVSMGCRVKRDFPHGSHQLFIADVICMYCEQELVRPDSRADPKATEQVVWLDNAFWGLRKL